MITCKVCDRQFRTVSNSHLRKHGLTTTDYAMKYGADFTSDETRHAKRKQDIDWGHVPLGLAPDSVIAQEIGVSRRRVCYARLQRNIPIFNGYLLTQEGRVCRSIYEAMYDAYLHWNQIEHEHEVPIPGLPYVADFRVKGSFVEIPGMMSYANYRAKYEKKRRDYELAQIAVEWIMGHDVWVLFQGCPLKLQFDKSRQCKLCGKPNYNLVKGYCRGTCYMKVHRSQSAASICEVCGNEFRALENSHQKFCSHSCYATSLKFDWPSWEHVNRELQTKSAMSLAKELGVKPSTLYMRIRRRKQRNNGVLV